MSKQIQLPNKTLPEIEAEVTKFWKENQIFEKVTKLRENAPKYRFVDGPPFPNDVPHYGHMLCSVAKDVIPRYQTMKGKSVRRVFGWDCHGLAVEEKLNSKLGIKGEESKDKIENEIGIKNYIQMCRDFVGTNIDAWRWYMDKLGRWSDMDHAYKTMDQKFGESVVWAFKQLWDKGLIYKGKRTSLYSTDSGTPVSEFEVNMDPDNYQETEDVSVYMKFRLINPFELSSKVFERSNVFVLAWTTTPWTLYANFALAVNEAEDYLLVKYDENKEEHLVLADKLFDQLKQSLSKEFVNPQVIDKFKGKELLNLNYEQYLPDIPTQNSNDFKIYHGDHVSMEDGTGIVHIAPAYGAEDFEMGKKFELSDYGSIDNTGHLLVGSYKGKYLRDANLEIAKELLRDEKVLKIKSYKHRLPYYRGVNPLIYKTQDAWFIDVQKIKPRMLELIDQTNWIPESIRDGRWKNTIESSPDWCISRERYWNTIMPIWVNLEDENDMWVIGSIQEMMDNSNDQIYKKDDKYYLQVNDNEVTMHRDICDDIILHRDGKHYKRISQVLDNWMDAGSVPFAEYHYPFENTEVFKSKPSADFIVEYVGQVRAWFNVLYRMSVGVFDDIAFDNVICTGVVAGNDGRKMSKSYGNYPDSTKVLNEVGGEAVRLFLMNSPLLLGGDAECKEETIKDQVKIILLPLLNSLKYFVLYAEDFKYDGNFVSDNFSDTWILTKLSQLIVGTDTNLSNYNIPNVAKDLQTFINELSSWYIKTNRDRFVSKDNSALQTLYRVLLNLTFSMSPLIPFVTEYSWQVLKDYQDKFNFESVHMVEWENIETTTTLQATSTVEQFPDVFSKMEEVRDIISAGLKIRDENKIPVKQVLSSVEVSKKLTKEQIELIKQELNVFELVNDKLNDDLKIKLDLNITNELRLLGLVREITSFFQLERKQIGLNLEDEVNILYNGSNLVLDSIEANLEQLSSKIKAQSMKRSSSRELLQRKTFGSEELWFAISKVD
ncbi:isoleucine--tRNA ligase [bacterium]|nr:MAG: isoleucine--tRNA ligase [bacterium]